MKSTSVRSKEKRATKSDFENQVIARYQSDVRNQENKHVNKEDIRHIIRLVFGTLTEDMRDGYTIPITNFAVFGSILHHARKLRDPSGHKCKSAQHMYPHIRPYKHLKDVVKNG